MIKKLLILMLATLMIFAFASCDNSNSPEDNGTNTDEGAVRTEPLSADEESALKTYLKAVDVPTLTSDLQSLSTEDTFEKGTADCDRTQFSSGILTFTLTDYVFSTGTEYKASGDLTVTFTYSGTDASAIESYTITANELTLSGGDMDLIITDVSVEGEFRDTEGNTKKPTLYSLYNDSSSTRFWVSKGTLTVNGLTLSVEDILKFYAYTIKFSFYGLAEDIEEYATSFRVPDAVAARVSELFASADAVEWYDADGTYTKGGALSENVVVSPRASDNLLQLAAGYEGYPGYYVIYNEAALKAWGSKASSDTSISALLVADITLTDNWTPIGSSNSRYKGIFEGAGFSINNLKIESTNSYVGMFSYIGSGGEVRNLCLENVNISGNARVGGIAGINSGGTIYNCYVGGEVTGNSSYVGGIVGQTTGDSFVVYCYSDAIVSGGNANVGGIVGIHQGKVVVACYFTGTVMGTSTDGSSDAGQDPHNVGGIVGLNSNNNSSIIACYSNATINVQSNYTEIGVICGGLDYGSTNACYYFENESEYGGVGKTDNTEDTTKKINDNTTWTDAAAAMNNYLSTYEGGEYTDYIYAKTDDDSMPLILVPNDNVKE